MAYTLLSMRLSLSFPCLPCVTAMISVAYLLPLHPDTGKAQIFIYDAYPGGIGIAEKGFDLMEELWQATLKAITECPCQEGCPSCIQSPKCGNNNKPLDKKAAQILLEGYAK